MNIPQNLSISMVGNTLRFTIGDHDLSDLPILQRGPIIECLTPGCKHRSYVAWVPVFFDGEVDDPQGMCSVVREGEAEMLINGDEVSGDK